MRTLILTCPQLDNGHRMKCFETDRFSQVEFVLGKSAAQVSDTFNISLNAFDYGFGQTQWDKPAIAVAYGHLKLWQRVKNLDENCLLLEDDAVPVPDFNYLKIEDWINHQELPERWLITLWKNGVDHFASYSTCFDRVHPSFANSGLVGYIVTPFTAAALIESFENMSSPVDHHVLGATLLLQSKFEVLVPKINLIGHRNGVSLREGPANKLSEQ